MDVIYNCIVSDVELYNISTILH